MPFFMIKLWLIYPSPMTSLDQKRQSGDTLGQSGADGEIRLHSAQADLHAAYVGVQLQPNGAALQVQDNASRVLEPNGRCPAAGSGSDADSRIGARNIGGSA
jgi:hypothetical protein